MHANTPADCIIWTTKVVSNEAVTVRLSGGVDILMMRAGGDVTMTTTMIATGKKCSLYSITERSFRS